MRIESRNNAKVLLRVDALRNQQKKWVQIVRIIAEEGYYRPGGTPYRVYNLAVLYNDYKSFNR